LPRKPLVAERVADDIAREISDGTLPAGAWLPSWADLANQRGVARGTARRVLEILAERELVELVPKIGAKVIGQAASTPGPDRIADLERRLDEAPTREEFERVRQQLDQVLAHLALDTEGTSSATPRRKRA
jgi:DNA-binding FadR family transcriptional regulator